MDGVAVVASLVYLALQVRQNTRAVRGSTLHLNTDLWGAMFLRLIDAMISVTPETDPGAFLREWQRIAQRSEPAA